MHTAAVSIGTHFFDELEGVTMTVVDYGDGEYEGWFIASDGSDREAILYAPDELEMSHIKFKPST